jgi:hypothetical protein
MVESSTCIITFEISRWGSYYLSHRLATNRKTNLHHADSFASADGV